MVAFLNIKKKTKKNNQFIKSVDSYNGNSETFVYNSYPNNQMMNNQMGNNQISNNQMMNNQDQMNYPNNMNYNQQGFNNQMPNQQYNQYPNNNQMATNNNTNYQNNNIGVIKPKGNNSNNNPNVIKPQTNNQPNETLDVLEPNDVLNEALEELPVEQEVTKLDPLNNANNPIPVNPVAEVEVKEELTEEELSAKANIWAVIGMFLGMIFKPGTTIIDSIKKYKDIYKGIKITLWVTVVTVLATLAVRILTGAFYRSYNSITGAYSINFNLNNVISLQNYLPYLVIAIAVSLVAILVATLIYYASSFFNSKGVNFGSYLAVSNVTMLPMIIGVVILNPVLSILSDYLGIIGIIVPFIYTLISFIIGIDYILKFDSYNAKIYYNVFNLSIILFIMVLIVVGLYNLNLISLPTLFT